MKNTLSRQKLIQKGFSTGLLQRALCYLGLTFLCSAVLQAQPAGPEWSWGLPIYQIATRYYNETGGFKEIEKDIPWLKSLNVGIIYIMPVHPCSNDTSWDAQIRCNNFQTADFQGVNPAMGSLQDYKDLVRALHANGMYVIQDMVPRHMHPGNNMLKLHPDWAKGESWGLPAWNFDNPDARQYMLESLKYWIREVDIDGYRIDVAGSDPLPEVFREFIPELRKMKPIFMLAEADGPRFHPHYDMTYDWRNLKTLIVEIVQQGGPASRIDENIRRDLSEYPDGALRMRHLDNHDLNVGMAPFGRIPGNMDERYGGGQKAFAVLAATMPGKWMYFMGNEINNPRRIPHAWGKEYDWIHWEENPEFTNLYSTLGAIHRYNPAVWDGNYRYMNTTHNDDLFVMERKKGDNVVFVVINFSASQTTGTIIDALPEGDFTEAFNGGTGPLSSVVDLPGWGYRVYVKDTPPRLPLSVSN
jgi:glycosidase